MYRNVSHDGFGDDSKSMSSISKQKIYGATDTSASLLPRPVYKLPPTHYEVDRFFQSYETKQHTNGKLNAKDLQMAFETFQGKRYSEAACKFVVRLFDLDKNGGLDIEEFENLYLHIKAWIAAFNASDRTRCGYLDEIELETALKSMELNFSKEFVRFLITRNDPVARRISVDQFIVACVQIQKFGEEFLKMDEKRNGTIELRYEQFLEMVLKCI